MNDGQGVGTLIREVLTSTIVPDNGAQWCIADNGPVAAPAEVLSNVWYTLVVSRPGADFLDVGIRTNNPSTDQMFYSMDLSGNNFTASGVTGYDMDFSTYIL